MSASDASRIGAARTRRHVAKAAALVWLALLDRTLRPGEARAQTAAAGPVGAPSDRCWCCGQVQTAPPEPDPGQPVDVLDKQSDEAAEARYARAQCDCDGCTRCQRRIVEGRLRTARTADDDCEEEVQFDLPRPPYARTGARAPCFLRGTRIRTAAGYRCIEELAPGEQLPSVFGGLRLIRRIRRTVLDRAAGTAPWPVHARPICIAPSAIAEDVPAAALMLTAAHALFIDGCLIPAGDLVNGTTIAPHETPGPVLELFHIELDGHDVIDAEGCPCESLLMPGQEACAPRLGFHGRRREVASRLRSAVAPWIDRRRPLDVIRDRLEGRGERPQRAGR